MKTLCVLILVMILLLPAGLSPAIAGENEILKESLLGMGSGLAGGAVSGGKGKNLWKGALLGAGVNIAGNAILDAHTGEKVSSTDQVDSMSSQDAFQHGYEQGFSNGYKQGYAEAYNQGYKEGHTDGRSAK